MGKLREREAESKEKQRLSFNQRHNAVPLKALQPGTPVLIKESVTTNTITPSAETPRSYLIETEKGVVRRNRSHINPIPNDKLTSPSTTEKTATPCVSKRQSQHKALTPLKPIAPPCLSSRDSSDSLSSYGRALDFAEHLDTNDRDWSQLPWTLFVVHCMQAYYSSTRFYVTSC